MNWLLYLAVYDPDSRIYDQFSDLGFGKALIVSLIAILVVFLVLCIVIGAVKLMQLGYEKFGKKESATKQVSTSTPEEAKYAQPKKVEITDDDMMVATLIATIDYTNETKKDVKVKSIRRIG